MHAAPFLLAKSCCYLPSSEKMRSVYFSDCFCKTEPSDFSIDTINKIKSQLPEKLESEWHRCIAEELLCLLMRDKAIPEPVVNKFHHIFPFGNLITIKEIINKKVAVAVIPLKDNERENPADANPQLAHIWIIEGPETQSTELDGLSDILPENFSIFAVTQNGQSFTERSWQLGFKLALTALKQNNTSVKEEIAKNWIISGAVYNNEITKIVLENKLNIKTDKTFLFPRLNRAEAINFLSVNNLGNVFFRTAPDVSTAWNIVSGEGSVDIGVINPPDNTVEFHSFVSKAWQPVISSILLLQPKKIVLWYTDNEIVSYEPAVRIKEVLIDLMEKDYINHAQIALEFINSRKIQDAEKALQEKLSKRLRSLKTPLIFNVTQGNRLMSFAVHTLAKQNPNLWMIYRDLDGEMYEFICIKYGLDNNPETSILRFTKKPQNVNFAELFKVGEPPQIDTKKNILNKIVIQ